MLEQGRRLLRAGGRRVLGIAGAPASGKSTLATWLVRELDPDQIGRVALVGMDGFHLAHQVLAQRGLIGIKGAPHTFDAAGYVHLLRRIRETTDTVYAPEFRREIEDSVAQAVEIDANTSLVITEGNYLLLTESAWAGVRDLLDEAWFLYLDDEERRRRMVARRLGFGFDMAAAEAMTYGSDEANALLINTSSAEPDLWVEHSR